MLAVLAALAAVPAAAAFAQKPVTLTDGVEVTAKIDAIDHTERLVTLKDKDGSSETIYAGPEVKRFDELKVGDTVTFRYIESVVYQIRKPGQAATAPAASGEAKIVRGTGPRPGGTASRQETITVEVKAIDPKAPSVTVLTPDKRTVSMKVEDKKNLQGLAVGDKVEITYTEAFVISVK
jgi:Cu/Ag efflux protein CusF